ncbi:MAG: AIR synthase-related protein, partial [Thermoplasmata archaeon]
SDGGLAVTLAEMAFGGGLGFDVDLSATGLAGPGVALAAEGRSRLLVEVAAGSSAAFERAMRPAPCRAIGTVQSGEGSLRWGDRAVASVDLAGLYGRWHDGLTLP